MSEIEPFRSSGRAVGEPSGSFVVDPMVLSGIVREARHGDMAVSDTVFGGGTR